MWVWCIANADSQELTRGGVSNMLALELPVWLTNAPRLDPNSPWTGFLVLNALGFWFIAYLLIIFRGFRDQSFGMPVVALCANLVWEGLGAFVLPISMGAKVAQLFSFVPDLLILYTCLKYGPADFTHPLIRKWFHPLVGVGIAMAVSVQLGFMTAFQDRMGTATGYFTNLLLSVSFIAMVLRRQSVRGQSFYIALCIVLGNAFAWPIWVLSPEANPRPPTLLGHACFLCIVSMNLIYATLVYRQCRLDGLNPWRRA